MRIGEEATPKPHQPPTNHANLHQRTPPWLVETKWPIPTRGGANLALYPESVSTEDVWAIAPSVHPRYGECMKTVVFSFCLLALPCAAQTSAKHTSAPTHDTTHNLKDDFAKSAFRVLRMVEGETGEFSLGEDGSILVPKVTNQATDDLDADAQTKEEMAVVDAVNTFFLARLHDNMTIKHISALIEAASLDANRDSIDKVGADNAPPLLTPLQIADAVSKSPTVALIHVKESACSEGLEAVLKERSYHEVSACSKDALAVPSPKALDLPVN